jgi:hypothetical protein
MSRRYTLRPGRNYDMLGCEGFVGLRVEQDAVTTGRVTCKRQAVGRLT